MTEINQPVRRVSDQELKELRAEFRQHIKDEHSDRKEQQRIMLQNAQAINDLTASVGQLTVTVALNIEATAPLVEIHREVVSAAKLGAKVGDLFIWLAKFGVAGGALIAAANWVLEHLPKTH